MSDDQIKSKLFSAQFYLKSGLVLTVDNFTTLNWTRTGEEVTMLEWEQDLTRGLSGSLQFISLSQIDVISTKVNVKA